ncbi:hypothetical protein HA402_002111 [Bradysia odoriphaga]|nr:hypothetical protein HA402_002111 [Bradysia odoriphaga]
MLLITHVILFLICVNYRKVTCDGNHTVASVYVDDITSTYIDIEEKLWFLIGLKNQSDLVLNIHREHLIFFQNSFSLDRPRTESYKANIEKHFGWEVQGLNSEIYFVKNFGLHESIDEISADDTVQMATTYVGYSNLMATIYNRTVETNLFGQIDKMLSAENCSRSKHMESAELMIFNYYTDVATYLLKSYCLVQLSYMLLTLYGYNDYTLSSAAIRSQFKDHYKTIQSLATDSMLTAERRYWVCDGIYPQYFAQATNFVQDYFENEVNLNKEGSCYNSCSDYTLTKDYGCYDGTLCHLSGEKARCKGAISSCKYIESPLHICADEEKSRQYYNVKKQSGEQLGQSECDNIFKVSSWNRWFVECSFCRCSCFNDDSHKYFSLQPVLSDKILNKIVTGVALEKHNQTFYWKIAQATLLRRGEVQSEIDNWVPIKAFNLTDVHDGYDYHTLSWQNRSIALDSLMVPSGSVITGIRFKSYMGRLHFEIQATKFDFATGKLYDSFEWISSKLNRHRDYINLDENDLPEKSVIFSQPMWKQNLLVEFQSTDTAKDLSQSTIPYIDTQLVEPSHPAPLAGIGLYYKGIDGFGGYIAPYLVPYNYFHHINDTLK